MLERLKIGTRLAIALGLMALLVVAVAVSGRLGLGHVEDTMQQVLLRDAHLAEEALQARAATLQLRRYEKDFFLNIGAPDKQADYLTKWGQARADLIGHVDELERLVSSKEDKEILRGMRDDLARYMTGFDQVGAEVRSGELATPQAANIAITRYKDAIRKLETTAAALGGASDFRMRERVKILSADARSTNTQMTVTAALALMVAILLSIRLSSSITVPIRGLVTFARRLAAGELSTPLAVTARDEMGELQEAMRAITDRLARGAGGAQRVLQEGVSRGLPGTA